MIDISGHEHIVWTCMWCGQMNAFLWDEPGFAYIAFVGDKGTIFMQCEFCKHETKMERAK